MDIMFFIIIGVILALMLIDTYTLSGLGALLLVAKDYVSSVYCSILFNNKGTLEHVDA